MFKNQLVLLLSPKNLGLFETNKQKTGEKIKYINRLKLFNA